MEQIQVELLNLVVAVLTALVGVATKSLVSFLKKKGVVAQVQNNKEVVAIVVKAVEQMYGQLKGEEKLDMAKMELIKLMQQKKIKMTEAEIDLMIEAMVKEMKDSANSELKK
ncbi:phage holin family protein [Klebsiella pneumoniae]|nr:phage holin family protein [Klebsiella pneumoniae]MDS7714330.1 phage holin family protein [Klebsiella pneumoniae]UUV46201.1 holin [Bacillus phage vB_BanS-Thrax2]